MARTATAAAGLTSVEPAAEIALPRTPGSLSQANTSLSIQVRNVDDLKALAAVFAASGMFGRSQNQQQTLATCAVQLLAGMEAGFTPFASITGIYLVNGRPGFSAQLLAQAIKRHPSYDYRVRQKDAVCCTIAFFEAGEELGVETFTMDMARRAGLVGSRGPWQQYPEAMLFARCLTAGMRTHCPDALGGHAPYTPEELVGSSDGVIIDEHGMVIASRSSAAPSPELEQDRDRLTADALSVVKRSGLTAAGVRTMLAELGGPEVSSLGQLDDAVLRKLAVGGITAATAQRWNAEAESSALQAEAAEPLDAPDASADDELPLSWEATA